MTLDIGGPDVLTYRDVMAIMPAECGLRRRVVVSVPFLLPTLSAVWIHRLLRLRAEGIRVAAERSAAGRDRLPRSRAG